MTTEEFFHAGTTLDGGIRPAIGVVLDREPFRRFFQSEPPDITSSVLSQSLHIDRIDGSPRRMLGGASHMYYTHSLTSARSEIDELLRNGISSVYLQLYPETDRGPAAALDHFGTVVGTLHRDYGDVLRLEVDTAGLCMGEDLRWGVRDSDGQIDPHQSFSWLERTAAEMAQLGANSLVVVGRLNYEAFAARAGVDRSGYGIELWGFSTNSETPNAYFDAGTFDAQHAVTHQKIHVGNVSEMLLRALRDIHEGLGVVIQKPMENIALTTVLRLLIQGVLTLDQCFGLDRFGETYEASVELFGEDWLRSAHLAEALPAVRLGVYEVSGTYSMYRMIEDGYSTELARAILREQLLNIRWSLGPTLHRIISRNALWYAKGLR